MVGVSASSSEDVALQVMVSPKATELKSSSMESTLGLRFRTVVLILSLWLPPEASSTVTVQEIESSGSAVVLLNCSVLPLSKSVPCVSLLHE